MMPVVVALLAAAPCLYWTQGIETRPAVEAAGIKRLCVPPDQVEPWRKAGVNVSGLTDADLAAREALPTPGVTARAGVASPTRAPWIVASGWHFLRAPSAKYAYSVPAGKGALAAAEAVAYGADVILKIDATDLAAVGAVLTFAERLPASELPAVADFAVVDDGSPATSEVINLLVRRNLLFEVAKAPSPRFRMNVVIGSATYSREEAADPSGFAQKVRAQLTDDQRSLRIYGSEVVIGRLTSDGTHARLHLINYGGRDIEGLRIRVRGTYRTGQAFAPGATAAPVSDQITTEGATEFTLPRLGTYAVIDLK